MPANTLATTEEAVTAAIRAGHWSRAQGVLAEYCAAATTTLRGMAADAPAAAALAARVRDYLAWATQMARAGRAQLAEEIHGLPSLSGYASPISADRCRHWHLDA